MSTTVTSYAPRVLLLSALLSALLLGNSTTVIAATASTEQRLTLAVESGDVIRIPRRAVVMRDGIPGVFVVRDGEARFRMVRTGAVAKQSVEILSGLFGDETLLLDDVSALYDGQPLTSLQQGK
jgi:hypothetical protein